MKQSMGEMVSSFSMKMVATRLLNAEVYIVDLQETIAQMCASHERTVTEFQIEMDYLDLQNLSLKKRVEHLSKKKQRLEEEERKQNLELKSNVDYSKVLRTEIKHLESELEERVAEVEEAENALLQAQEVIEENEEVKSQIFILCHYHL